MGFVGATIFEIKSMLTMLMAVNEEGDILLIAGIRGIDKKP